MSGEKDEPCGNCDRAFGTRINYIEEDVKSLMAKLEALRDRENKDTTEIKTRIAIVERDIKWWGTLGGIIGGFGVDFVSRFWR